jgi:hypothetical protein
MLKNMLNRIRTSIDTFIRKHICDDASNIWPNMTDEDWLELERR